MTLKSTRGHNVMYQSRMSRVTRLVYGQKRFTLGLS